MTAQQLALKLSPRAAVKRERKRGESKHAAEIKLLVPLAVELARKAGRHGITVDDIRIHAENAAPPLIARSVDGKQRALSWLPGVPIAAKLAKTNQRRLSRNRNDQVVWVLHAFSHDGAA